MMKRMYNAIVYTKSFFLTLGILSDKYQCFLIHVHLEHVDTYLVLSAQEKVNNYLSLHAIFTSI